MRHFSMLFVTCCTVVVLDAQAPAPTFDVVSIKKSEPGVQGGGARTMPDGATVITNQPI